VTNPNTQPAASNDPFAGIIDNLHAAFVGEPTADQGNPVNFGGEPAPEPAPERTPAQGVCEGILLAVLDGWYTVRGIAHRTQISPPYITDALAACSLVAPTGGGEPGNEEYVPTAEGVLKAQERGWALPSYTGVDVAPADDDDGEPAPVAAEPLAAVEPAPVATKAKRGGWNGMPTSEARDVTNQIISDQGLCPKWVTDVASGPFLDNLVHGSARDVKKAVTGCLDPAALRGVIDRELAQPRIRKGNLSTALNRLAKLVGLDGSPAVAAPPLTEQERPQEVVEVLAAPGDDTAAAAAAPVPVAVALQSAREDAATAQVAVADAIGEIATLTAHVAALTAQVQSVDARRIESDREITRLRGIIDGHAAATKAKDDCLADRDQNIEGLQATVEQLERDLDRAREDNGKAGDALAQRDDRTDAQQALLAITAQLIDRIAAS